jgi:alkylation response protein AidB-like acyl-CoA dehydrogenase
MQSPGIEVTLIITIDGSHEVNSVFFADVQVPVGHLIGEENQGWSYAKFFLLLERSNSLTGSLKQQLRRLRGIAEQEVSHAGWLCAEAVFAARLADYDIQLRTLANARPGTEASYLKIIVTNLRQLASEFTF